MNLKRLIVLFAVTVFLSSFTTGVTASVPTTVNVVPKPADAKFTDGEFELKNTTSLIVPDDSLKALGEEFSAKVKEQTGINIRLNRFTASTIVLEENASLAQESYKLTVTPDNVVIEASGYNGFLYALQTLRQLITKNDEGAWVVPCVEIIDSPRFAYRGMMLDVSRYFVPKDEILKLIDAMSLLKLNKLHLHLTDDNGWRLEIKQYPELTNVGAWRVDREDIPFPARRNATPDEKATVGGFYTQDDMREVVAYAKERGIEVIPEVDMPAHANAALAGYPQFACTVVEEYIAVLPGLGGDHADIIYCAGNDSVITFLQNILDEVIDIFPSQYIHLGGDEAWKTYWDKCPLCQARIEEEHLADSEALQGWFMTKMSDYVRSKGRKVIGWDELTNSAIPEDAVIMGWQGDGSAALKGAAQGHRFIMTPARLMYFIRYQGPQWFEPYTYFGGGDLKEVYEYEPVKETWKPEYEDLLMGVQGSMWNEFCNTPQQVEHQLFPRLTALAEVGWRDKGSQDWQDYLQRLDAFLPLLEAMDINYATSMYNIQQTVKPDGDTVILELACIRPDVEIRYTTDGSEPTENSQLYTAPVKIGKDVSEIKSATFEGSQRKGEILNLPINWHKATGKKIEGSKGLDYVLTNGVKGSMKYTDSEWASWNDRNVKLTLDLEKPTDINDVTLGFINNYGMGVHRPEKVVLSVSDNGTDFHKVAEKSFIPSEVFAEGVNRYNESFALENVDARYLRIDLEGADVCPPGHVRPGKKVQFFIDEITVK